MRMTKRPKVKQEVSAVAERLERAKQGSTAQLLMRCARLVNERGLLRARERVSFPLRKAHLSLFPHIDLAGTRQTELARRLDISKQAVHQLVAELVEHGVLEHAPDPSDGRALLVRFTPRGAQSLLDGLAVLNGIEDEMRRALGAERMDALHATLTELDAWLEG